MTQKGIFPWKARKIGGRFRNLFSDYVPGLAEVIRWKLSSGFLRSNRIAGQPQFQLPETALDFSEFSKPASGRILVTWLGHSTFLLKFGGRVYLTDPILSAYCSPLPLRQFRSSIIRPVSIQDLPEIDAVLLSHNHFDHMDRPTLRKIGSQPMIFCPTGVGEYLRKWGVDGCKELSWGDSADDHGIRITAVPAQHGSARAPWDRNRSLWCGWMLEYGERRLHFLGDTGYAPFFREFADYFGPIDLAFIPIGAYRPGWFMQPLHLNPMEAVVVHRELRARQSVAMHWGTFRLSDEPLDEPARLLRAQLEQSQIASDEFRIPRLYETLAI